MTHVELKELISCLKENGVESFKLSTLEIKFKSSPPIKKTITDAFIAPSAPVGSGESSNSAPLDQSLVTNTQPEDETMNFDKILHWSSSQDPSEVPLPLTGEGTT